MIKILFYIDILAEYCMIEVLKFKWKHALKTSPPFTARRESFAVEFVVIKHFGRKSLRVEPFRFLDVEKYMLKCVFC